MIEALSIRFTDYLDRQLDLSDQDKIKIRYVFQLLTGDLTKLILLFLLFLFLGHGTDFLYSAFVLMLLRPVTGGLHFKSYWGCFAFSLVFFTLVILCQHNVPLTVGVGASVLAVCIFVIALLAPLPGPSRPNYSLHERRVFKLKGCALVLIHLTAFLLMKNNPYCVVAFWVILFQTIQLIMKKGGHHHEIQSTR